MKKYQTESKISELNENLQLFLKNNPLSSIKEENGRYIVVNPWGDGSLSFLLFKEIESELIDALNKIILSPRFTALYHLDSNTMEYIFAPLKKDNPYGSREFEFFIDAKKYNCKFKASSTRLLTLSKAFLPIEEESSTLYRNLLLYSLYINPELRKHSKLGEDFFKDRIPISFFVDGFEKFEEDKIVEVSKHLNFYMSYYDRKSPLIILHSAKTEQSDAVKELQLVGPEFPNKISCSQKNAFLLDLYLAAQDAASRLKFIYFYQILEYAAFYYIDTEIKQSMKKIIMTPDILANTEKYINNIIETITAYRETDEAKIHKVVKICCSANIIWNEIQENKSYFAKRQAFEGGFIIEPFISEDMSLDSFSSMWIPKTPDTLRKIRNSLVHAREGRQDFVISPTKENDFKLAPWIPVIRRIAEQVLISC